MRITHLPTGLVVTCQNDRSQHKNKASAMSVLKARLHARMLDEQREKMAGITGAKKEINFGSQIRSYVLHPYQQIKDHRTDIEYSQVQSILDGALDPLIEAYLKQDSLEAVKANSA